MIDSKLKILVSSVRKLLRRGALRNIKGILDKTHTADIAHLLNELDEEEKLQIFKLEMTTERRAEILSYMEVESQKQLLARLEPQLVNTVVGEMESDDAADLLGQLTDDMSKKILDSMDREDKEEVQDLMRYPEDSAGGIMSPDFLSLNQTLTVSDAIQLIQSQEDESVIAFYIYVTDDDQRLVGVLSLKQLLLSKPAVALRDIMIRDIVSVTTETNQVEVASLVERYDFLSLPVVDESYHLVGVITVDDVIDVIKQEAQEDLLALGQVTATSAEYSLRNHLKGRIPWLTFVYLGGLICYFIIISLVESDRLTPLWALTAFLPLLLAVASTAGHQAAVVTVEGILSGRMSIKDTWEHLWHELKVSLLLGVVFGAVTFGVSIATGNTRGLSGFIAVVLLFQVLAAMMLASLVPLSLRRMNLDPTVSTISIVETVANISSVLVLFGIAYRFFALDTAI